MQRSHPAWYPARRGIPHGMISCAAFSRELVQSMSAEDLAQHLKDCLLRAFDQRYQILSGSPLRPNNVSRNGSGTGLTLPHLHRDWAHPSCSCTGSELLYFSRGTKPVAKHGLVRAPVVPSISHTQPPQHPLKRSGAPTHPAVPSAMRPGVVHSALRRQTALEWSGRRTLLAHQQCAQSLRCDGLRPHAQV